MAQSELHSDWICAFSVGQTSTSVKERSGVDLQQRTKQENTSLLKK